jgi:beta-ribofuranosylaminobenzene 5'-phosphate synthase
MRSEPLKSVAVIAPSRLHFGLFSLGDAVAGRYIGVGAMIQSPGLRISVRRGNDFVVKGVHADRARAFAELVLLNLCKQRACEHKRALLQRHLQIEVEYAPRQHIGLGVGTQLGLSIAAAICVACELRRPHASDLAYLAERSARSGIGTYGFGFGGFLVDVGKSEYNNRRPISHANIPTDWRFVLFCPKTAGGISGDAEKAAFQRLPPTRLEIAKQSRHLALAELAPAAAAGDFDRFSRSLYEFNHMAGSYFASAQGGIFASEQTTSLVARLRRMGIDGVGQSSWGPTVFALCDTQAAAEGLLRQVGPDAETEDYECLISGPSNQGAVIEILSDE